MRLFESFLLSWGKVVLLSISLLELFSVSHRLWITVFWFSIVSRNILISSLISSVICWLFSSVLFSLHMFVFFAVFPLWLISNLTALWLGKNAWCNFNFLKFTEVFLYWEEYVFCCFWMEWSGFSSPVFHLRPVFPYWFSCLDDLSTDASRVLKVSHYIALLLISPFMAVSICLIYWGAPMLGVYIFTLLYLHIELSFDYYVVSFVSCKSLF